MQEMSLHNDIQLIYISEENFFLVSQLRDESSREGYSFVEKTIQDWESAENRFSRPGEQLWGLVSINELVGIGGLNYDPYTDDSSIGRVRHLYIRPAFRRKGCATMLMEAIIGQARQHFRVLRLFTANPAAAIFYEALCFQPTCAHKVSHFMLL